MTAQAATVVRGHGAGREASAPRGALAGAARSASAAGPAPVMVSIAHLHKAYAGVPAVRGVSLDVVKGDFVTILGPSGCGKTTLLKMIAGFVAPDSGAITLGGRPVAATPPHLRSIGMVFQRLALFPHMTVEQNVSFPLRMRGFAKAGHAERVSRFLEIVRLTGFGSRYPHELSGGQQQRVAIARALVFEPELLLLDEPLSSLDRKLREEMQDEFKRIQAMLGVTTINVTHDQKEALLLSDQLVVMRDGLVEQAGPPREVYRRPRSLFVASFLGAPILLRGVVASGAHDGCEVVVGALTLRASTGGAALAPGATARLALRMEQAQAGPGAERCGARVLGEVAMLSYEGDRTVCKVRCPALGGAEIKVFLHEGGDGAQPGVGDPLLVGWDESDLLAFPDDGA
jgi:putative spermidine/putrescine transport system ATP-binding protein